MARILRAGTSTTGATGSAKDLLLKRPHPTAGIVSRRRSDLISNSKYYDRSASSLPPHPTSTTQHNPNTAGHHPQQPCTPSPSATNLSEKPSLPLLREPSDSGPAAGPAVANARPHLRSRFSSFTFPLHRPSPRSMAFNSTTYSTASSDISTPRSSSPSFSINSARSSSTSISKRMSISSRRSQSQFNPMSSVNIAAIEAQMKMAALDGLRGYAQNHYGEVQQYRSTDYVPKSSAGGYQVLREPLWNKGMFLNCSPQRNCIFLSLILTHLPRSLIFTRGQNLQELDWSDSSRHGER